MVTISLCMIVKNEEKNIERCLNSVKNLVDEIIIADTGSTDKTKEIAGQFTDKIFDFQWIDDFSAARNFAFSKASMDYILWLDADDIIRPEDAEKFAGLKETLADGVDVVMMKYNTGFDSAGKVTFSYFRERLIKRIRGYKWKEPVHEYLEVWGMIINSEIAVTHAKEDEEKSPRNILIYENLIKNGGGLSPRGQYYFARELRENRRFGEAALWFNKFLEGKKGWVEDNINACLELAKCYQEENKPEEEFSALTRSFAFDTPRAEICCAIGYYFKNAGNYKLAAYWFKFAAGLKKPEGSWGFFQEDCWGYIPNLECAVCYDKLGDWEKAAAFNEKAGEYKPNSPAFLHNKKYFKERLKS